MKLPGYPDWPYKKCLIPYQHKITRTDVLTISKIQKQVEALAAVLAAPRHLAEIAEDDTGVVFSDAASSAFGSESGSD